MSEFESVLRKKRQSKARRRCGERDLPPKGIPLRAKKTSGLPPRGRAGLFFKALRIPVLPPPAVPTLTPLTHHSPAFSQAQKKPTNDHRPVHWMVRNQEITKLFHFTHVTCFGQQLCLVIRPLPTTLFRFCKPEEHMKRILNRSFAFASADKVLDAQFGNMNFIPLCLPSPLSNVNESLHA